MIYKQGEITTFRQLREDMSNWTDEQLDCTLTIRIDDETYPAILNMSDDDGILDPDHPMLEHIAPPDEFPGAYLFH